jgi:hypothetical protein
LALDYIGRINKKAFVATFVRVFKKAFSKANITASFKSTRLVPSNLLMVLLKLNVKVRTPTPPLLVWWSVKDCSGGGARRGFRVSLVGERTWDGRVVVAGEGS